MNDKHAIRGLYIGWGLSLLMLGLAVFGKRPYGFYILLRWVACLMFVYSATVAGWLRSPVWTWLFAVEAVLFNPLVPVHFARSTWQILDWLSLTIIVAAVVAFSKHLRTQPPPP